MPEIYTDCHGQYYQHFDYKEYFVYVGNTRVEHRENGPAVIYNDGTEFYYNMGKLHRSKGPALIYHFQDKTPFYKKMV